MRWTFSALYHVGDTTPQRREDFVSSSSTRRKTENVAKLPLAQQFESVKFEPNWGRKSFTMQADGWRSVRSRESECRKKGWEVSTTVAAAMAAAVAVDFVSMSVTSATTVSPCSPNPNRSINCAVGDYDCRTALERIDGATVPDSSLPVGLAHWGGPPTTVHWSSVSQECCEGQARPDSCIAATVSSKQFPSFVTRSVHW